MNGPAIGQLLLVLLIGLGGKEVAQRSGKNENIIYGWLKVARSKPLMAALDAGQLGLSEARILSSLPATRLAELLPELQGQPEPFRLARIQRALDDVRSLPPPRGFYAKHVEGRTRRLLVQIAELMKGVREVRTSEELDLVREIVEIAARWSRDVQRAKMAPP